MPTVANAEWLAPLHRAGHMLLDLLYPPRCTGCGRPGELLCARCQAQVLPVAAPACRRCGRPSAAPGLCSACRLTPSSLDGITAAALFVPPWQSAIHAFKYHNLSALAPTIGARMAGAWRLERHPVDFVAPVPLHARRESERGFNQSALLARVIGAALGAPVQAAALVRRRDTPPQVGMSRYQRQENVHGAFACPGSAAGCRVLLVDDVCTTGATLEACAAALRSAGASRIWGLVAARPPWEPDGER